MKGVSVTTHTVPAAHPNAQDQDSRLARENAELKAEIAWYEAQEARLLAIMSDASIEPAERVRLALELGREEYRP